MRLRTLPTLIAAFAGTSLLAGCGVSNLVHHARPDEFLVVRQAPLVVPPDFALMPPQPGAPRPSTRTESQQTLEAMFGGAVAHSTVGTSILNQAGRADPSIRSTVGDPSTATAAKGEVTRQIVSAPQGDGREAQTKIPGS